MAWSPSQMQEFFNLQVLPLVWPGQQVTAVTIEDMRYKAGKQCEILYSLQCGDPTESHCRRVVVTFANENKLRKLYRHHYGGESSTAAGPTPCPVVFLPEFGCLVEFFPRDWALPGLIHALDPEEMAALLAQVGTEAERARRLPTVEVLRYKLHGRCVLRYIVEAPAGGAPTEVIGKVHKSGTLAVQVAQTLSILQPQAAAYGLIIPKPLRVIEEWGLLLMERVSGIALKPIVEQAKDPQQLKTVMGLAAATLVRLHCLRFESQKVRSLQTWLEKGHGKAASLHLVAPLLAQQADTLLRQIGQLGARSAVAPLSFIHGGFSPAQLLLEKGQIAVVDFDSSGLGDPAIDVGHFMERLHHIAVNRPSNAFRQLATDFLSEYQARLPEQRVAERVHLFLSAFLVRTALHTFERRPYAYGQAGPDSLPVLLLQEAAACLNHFP